MTDYTRYPPHEQQTRQVAVESVDVANQVAACAGRARQLIYVDLSHYVGATRVIPAVGEQWVIAKFDTGWHLIRKLPTNDPNQSAVIPTLGQHIIGSGQGPLELQGSQINVNAPLSLFAVSTTNRPTATTVPAGTGVFDLTLSKPIWSNGTDWKDASGATV